MTTPPLRTLSLFRRQPWRRAATVAASFVGAGALVVAASPAVSAAPIEQFTFEEESTTVLHDYCDTPGLTVTRHWQEHGSVRLIARGPDQLPYAQGAFQGSVTYTNVSTGAAFTFAWRSVDRDARVVDNGDGTSTAIIQVSGNRSYYVDGRRVAAGTGTLRDEVLVDNGGTPSDPSDDAFLELLDRTTDLTGHDETDGFDRCGHLAGH